MKKNRVQLKPIFCDPDNDLVVMGHGDSKGVEISTEAELLTRAALNNSLKNAADCFASLCAIAAFYLLAKLVWKICVKLYGDERDE